MDIVEVFARFPKQEDCLAYLEELRWGGSPKCPYCGCEKHSDLSKEHRYHCNSCNASYSVTVDTIFHKTHMPLQKWFLAITLILNAKKGVAARQIGRHLNVNRNTAWRIGMQIRAAMRQEDQRDLLSGIVEMDETYVGGKPRKGGKGGPRKRGLRHKEDTGRGHGRARGQSLREGMRQVTPQTQILVDVGSRQDRHQGCRTHDG